ncbi:MAG: choice-of-anchor D domain-containing protein [Myxococcaceae bacterium]|nr:choice-of-anchor D domain-containing protein [Myxococcaceae bacterium]
MTRFVVLGCALALGAGCRQSAVKTVEPRLGTGAPTLDLGVTKVGQPATRTLELSALTQADVELTHSLEGDSTFSLDEVPVRLGGLTTAPVSVRFLPTAAGPATATLTLRSNDVTTPTQTVTLEAQGAFAGLVVAPACDAASGCTGTTTSRPPSIDHGEEPLLRRLPLEEAALPAVVLRSTGLVPVTLTARIVGPDAAAFTLTRPAPLELPAGETVRLPVRFVPTEQRAGPFSASLVIESDAPAAARVDVALSGRARPNQAPSVCLNLSEVQPPGGAPPVTFGAATDWVRPAPAGGYDFTASRVIPPRAVVTFSAHAPGGPRECTADPEDGRLLLTYAWALEASPAGAPPPALAGDQGPVLRLAPVATGDYGVRLTVRDAQGNASEASARFRVEVRNELVVQLSWSGPDGGGAGVDLDLHLVRPGGSPFGVTAADGGATTDDVSGATVGSAVTALGLTSDWGQPGPSDDPRLNVDDSGDGPLVENISLDGPALGCTATSCRYGVFVHAFRDARPVAGGPACTVSGCVDGEPCGCPSGLRCVADAAPRDGGATGAGRCRSPVQAQVRVFARGAAIATLPLPSLMPPDVLALSAPCQLLHVADVEWPRAGVDAGVTVRAIGADPSGRITTPSLSRFGWRPPGPTPSLSCTPNTRLPLPAGQAPWFAEEPR